MITFGYKKRFESVIRAIIAIALGVVMFLFTVDALKIIIQIIGIAILFAGLISLAPVLSRNKEENQSKGNRMAHLIGWTTCGIASVLGLLIILKPEWFKNIFIIVVALTVILYCTIQLIALISAMNLTGFTPLPLVLTAAALIGAIVVMFFQPGRTICIISGVLLVIYGVAEILALFRIRKAEEEYIIRFGTTVDGEPVGKKAEATEVQDKPLITAHEAEFEEVKK